MPDLDPSAEFESLQRRAVQALNEQFPVVGRQNRLEATDIRVAAQDATPDDPHHPDNLAEQLRVKLVKGTWSVPITARLKLIRIADSHVLDESKRPVIIARLPRITSRYSYIVGGHERQHDSLFRSKARPYHIVAANGQVVGRWNVAAGTGFDIIVEPSTGRMQLKYRTSHVALYAVLRALGVSDDEMLRRWGERVFKNNKTRDILPDLAKLHRTAQKVERGAYKPPPPDELTTAVRDIFKNTKLRPDGMLAAFGKEFDHVSGENLLLSADRVLGISRGQQEQDDRQALSAKDFVSTDDFVAEYIQRLGKEIQKKIKGSIDRKETISDIFAPGMYSSAINAAFENAQRPDQVNPLSYISGYTRTTIRGGAFGGVKGEQVNLDQDKRINKTHLGFLDPVQTPEGEDTGIALHLSLGVRRRGKDLTIQVWDPKKNTMREATPGELERVNVAYPDQVVWKDGKAVPRDPKSVLCYDANGGVSGVPWEQVSFVLRSAKNLFGMSANRIPFLPCDQGNRAQFGAKQQEQAEAVLHREAPLVQAVSESGKTYDDLIGQFASTRAPVDGVVQAIQKDRIILLPPGGKPRTVHIYDHFPLNGGKMMLTSTPVVHVGQRVQKGDLLADSNYTKGGVYADGLNARVAYVPFHGLNFEDGIVVSESFAKRATSVNLHVESAYIAPGMLTNTNRWRDYVLPEKATPERVAKLGADGVIKEGQHVARGDVLIAVLAPSGAGTTTTELANISRKLVADYKDRSVTWEHDVPGVVRRVVRSTDRIEVHVYTEAPLVAGDKLSGRHGNKGIVSKVLPDDQMPHDKHGKPVEILLNPAGVPSRMNVGQNYETALGRVAKKLGRPIHVPNFETGLDYGKWVQDTLKKHGEDPECQDELFDPATGASIGRVFTGYQHILKLHHVVDKKMTARSYGGAYNPHGTPPSGSGVPGGGQRMDQLTTYALLAHGAVHALQEANTFKSDADQADVWVAIQSGQPLPAPKTPRVVGHFMDYLRGMGVQSHFDGSKYHFAPMTDAQTKQVSNGQIKFADRMLQAKGDRTILEAGGLFDPHTTGGLDGKYWSHIELARRVPNPTYERPICRLLGINEKEFAQLVGPELVDGKSGFEVINDRLAKIDVDKELKEAEELLQKTPMGTRLDQIYQKVRYLRALKKMKLSPLDAYTNKLLPVVPPSVRRVSVGLDGSQIVHDLNGLYRQVGQINHQILTAHPSTPKSSMQKLHASLYESVKGLRSTGMDLGEGTLRRHHNGLMEMLVGQGGPKTSFFHQNVVGKRQDLSGRSTIIPKPDLSIDQIGIPQPMAMEFYKPFIVSHLVKSRGYSPNAAGLLVRKGEEAAVAAMHEVIKDHPIYLKRDPALHKFSIMAFYPTIIPGKAVGLHPLSCAGFNADFDGDTMALYVPITREAIQEAKRLTPSTAIFSPTHGGLMPKPSQDGLVGLFLLSEWGTPYKGTLKDTNALIHAMEQGAVPPSAVVPGPGGKETTIGRLALNAALPAAMQPHQKLLFDKSFRLDKGGMSQVLTEIGKSHPKDFGTSVDRWKDLGNRFAYLRAASFKLSDFTDGKEERDKIIAPYLAEYKKILAMPLPKAEKDKKILDLWFKAQNELKAKLSEDYKKTGRNHLYNNWIQSGARGDWGQFAQLVSGAVLVTDASNKPVPIPIVRSLGEGLGISDYWAHMHGARKGTLDRASGTADPGALTKDIMNTSMTLRIIEEDCGTTKGVELPATDKDLDGRYTAKPVKLPDNTAWPAAHMITPADVKHLQALHVATIEVRSAMHCKSVHGICAKCYGSNEYGKLNGVGTNIGVIAGHALGEPVTQLAMKTFHTGGAASSEEGLMDSFKRAKQLFRVPKVLPNQAVLATVEGKVERIVEDKDLGGHEVWVGGTKHYVPAKRAIKVVVGQAVTPGTALSSGPSNPVDLLRLTKSVPHVRNYLAQELTAAYHGGGGNVKRRNVETVVRAMTNVTRIEDAAGHPEYTRGDYAPLSEVIHKNESARARGAAEIRHTPALRPMTELPLIMSEDVLGRLNYARLEHTYLEAGAQGWSSDIHGHPIAGIVHGAGFANAERTRALADKPETAMPVRAVPAPLHPAPHTPTNHPNTPRQVQQPPSIHQAPPALQALNAEHPGWAESAQEHPGWGRPRATSDPARITAALPSGMLRAGQKPPNPMTLRG